jgi:hypothetical protein
MVRRASEGLGLSESTANQVWPCALSQQWMGPQCSACRPISRRNSEQRRSDGENTVTGVSKGRQRLGSGLANAALAFVLGIAVKSQLCTVQDDWENLVKFEL